MNYPDNFETPAFPAGKPIAVSRMMSIGIMVVFLLILFVCAILLWVGQSRKVHPFLVTINNSNGQWQVIAHDHGTRTALSANYVLQESVVINFAKDWFTISPDMSQNNIIWGSCDRMNDCNSATGFYGDKKCAIYCQSGDDLYRRFAYNVIPEYRVYAESGVRWTPDMRSVRIMPAGDVRDAGGTWRISARITSNKSGPIDIIAYAKVAKNTDLYPRTMGYYIADFNSYRIN